jgi:hypothetical protein
VGFNPPKVARFFVTETHQIEHTWLSQRFYSMAHSNSCFAQFFYRVNPDKTMDSICGYCFEASAPSADREQLRSWETTHCCSLRLQRSA